MAILAMRQVSICALKEDRKAILEKLQSMGIMEIHPLEEDEALSMMDTTAARQTFDRNVQLLENALTTLNTYAPQKKSLLSMLDGKERISASDFAKVAEERDKAVDKAGKIEKAARKIAEEKAEIVKLGTQIEALRPWETMGVPMNFEGTAECAALIGTMPQGTTAESMLSLLAEKCPEVSDVDIDIVRSDSNAVYTALLTSKEHGTAVEEALRSAGFARPSSVTHHTPAEKIKRLEADIEKQEKKIASNEEKIRGMADVREELMRASDYFRDRSIKYGVLGTVSQSEEAFFLKGYVAEEDADRLTKAMESYKAFVEIAPLDPDDPGPTKLKNNRFSESAEGVLESYGLPVRGHVDPTFIMSIFYVIFFGMMFSDAGYGLIMFVACGIVLHKHRDTLETGLRKMLQLFFWCGISTAFWGLMYGGFFGDAIDVVAKTFFGYTGATPILKPLWFEPMGQPMRLLVWCMLFGLIHLFFGLGIKGWEYLKDKDIVGFVSDVLSWYLFLIGLILLLLPSDLFSSIAGDAFDFSGVAALHTPAVVLTLAGLVIIILMQERSKSNWVLRILLGAYDVYGVTGWLSDVLSYSRLLALGLATGVIANVINMMASMFGGGVVGAILFIIIFLVGHTLNFGINALGAYVHTNRLQFVEFFGKFYEGGGSEFKPFTTANKYVEIKEEN